MKKNEIGILTVAAFLWLFASSGARAQPTWDVGLKPGFNIANLAGDDADSLSTDSRIGFVGGVFAAVHVTDVFGVRVEGLYTQKGGTDDISGVDITVKLDYFEFPLLAVVSVPVAENVSFDAFAGPAIAFNINSKVKGEQGGLQAEIDIDELVKEVDFGGVVGIGWSFDTGPASILIDGRWTFGVTSFDDADDTDVKNSAFSFTGGVAIPLGSS
ncbi:MAG: PorT family protein [Candidatus Krumholzibacteria bacterium]|nr:PorT family protein [Candidatus Krumholzibacteria bacterium]